MFTSCSPARALAAGLPSQDHVYKITDESFRFHNKKTNEMRFKLDSTENPRLFEESETFSRSKFSRATGFNNKGGPEPLEKEIHEILDSKREDRLSNPFFELVQNTCQVRFSYLLCYGNFCKGPRTLRKVPQKCQKIAGC